MSRMSGTDAALACLRRPGWHSTNDLLRYSFQRRGRGIVVNSRVADLRRRGHVITCRCETISGEQVWVYHLDVDAEQAAA